jgi:hypothetical protein
VDVVIETNIVGHQIEHREPVATPPPVYRQPRPFGQAVNE